MGNHPSVWSVRSSSGTINSVTSKRGKIAGENSFTSVSKTEKVWMNSRLNFK